MSSPLKAWGKLVAEKLLDFPPRSFSLTPCYASHSLHVPCYIKLSASSNCNHSNGNRVNARPGRPRPSPQPPILLRETIGSIAVLTLNRPAARNSLSAAMIAALHAELDEIHDDKAVRGVVIARQRPRLLRRPRHEGADRPPRRPRSRPRLLCRDDDRLQRDDAGHRAPAEARGRGRPGHRNRGRLPARGDCDLAIASEAASFATPGVDIGLFCSTPMVALSRNVPRKQAMEMLLTGEPVPAARAREIGLVNRVVAAGTERDAAIALAEKVALKSAYTVKLGKERSNRQAEMNLADAYR